MNTKYIKEPTGKDTMGKEMENFRRNTEAVKKGTKGNSRTENYNIKIFKNPHWIRLIADWTK